MFLFIENDLASLELRKLSFEASRIFLFDLEAIEENHLIGNDEFEGLNEMFLLD